MSELRSRCALLRSPHVAGSPLVLPNAWDAASAREVVAAGFPVVATTSAGVAASLGHEDHEHAPAGEMFAAAARIARSVGVPVTVDAEAGYGMPPADLVAAMRDIGAAGCNLEDTDHATETPRDPAGQADRLRAVRAAASTMDYPLVVNARIDVFLPALLAGTNEAEQQGLVAEAMSRARAYLEAGADCVYPIGLSEPAAVRTFISGTPGPVNILALARDPGLAELAGLGAARISYGPRLYRAAMRQLDETLAAIAGEGRHAP